MKRISLFSYGVASWAASKVVARRHGTKDLTLLFTDTKYEDEDTYRWGLQAAANVGAKHVCIADGRDPWQVFFDERFLGNSRADPCSKILKRQLTAKWLAENCDPADTVVYVGIHISESDRFSRLDKKTGKLVGIKHRMAANGWKCEAPLCEPPVIGAQEMHDWAEREGIRQQRMYSWGFPHANCGGRCVKQGQAGWARLLQIRPDRFEECAAKEQEFQKLVGKNRTMLTETINGQKIPLPLTELRRRLEAANGKCGSTDWGGCACFTGNEADDETDDQADSGRADTEKTNAVT